MGGHSRFLPAMQLLMAATVCALMALRARAGTAEGESDCPTTGNTLLQRVKPAMARVVLMPEEEGQRSVSGHSSPHGPAGEINIVSYNLYWWFVKANNRWGELYARIREESPLDLIGFQECEDIEQVLDSSGLHGFGFYMGPNKPHSNPAPLAWNASTFSKIEGPGHVSIGSDRWGDRILTWVRLKHRHTHAKVFFANTHGPLGNCDPGLGENWATAIEEHRRAGDVLFMTGDFNCERGSAAMNKVEAVLPEGVHAHIDFILSKGAHAMSGGPGATGPSDHPLVQGTFSVQQ